MTELTADEINYIFTDPCLQSGLYLLLEVRESSLNYAPGKEWHMSSRDIEELQLVQSIQAKLKTTALREED
jgi:hypothetical protein